MRTFAALLAGATLALLVYFPMRRRERELQARLAELQSELILLRRPSPLECPHSNIPEYSWPRAK